MNPKKCAIRDIKRCLKQEGKTFIVFFEELNPAMDSLVEEYSEAQRQKSRAQLINNNIN